MAPALPASLGLPLPFLDLAFLVWRTGSLEQTTDPPADWVRGPDKADGLGGEAPAALARLPASSPAPALCDRIMEARCVRSLRPVTSGELSVGASVSLSVKLYSWARPCAGGGQRVPGVLQ